MGRFAHRHIGIKQHEQYEWAATHIKAGLGGVAVHDLDSDDIVDWIESLASGGELGRRSIQIVRMTLRAALAAAVKNGALNRNPAARAREGAETWDDDQLDRSCPCVATIAGVDRCVLRFCTDCAEASCSRSSGAASRP